MDPQVGLKLTTNRLSAGGRLVWSDGACLPQKRLVAGRGTAAPGIGGP